MSLLQLAQHPAGPSQGVKLTYINNVDMCGNPKTTPRTSIFVLSCNKNTEYSLTSIQQDYIKLEYLLHVTEIEEPGLCTYQFDIATKYACPGGAATSATSATSTGGNNGGGGKKEPLSGGSIFLIIFFVGFAAYFLIGVVVKWQVYHASGVEVLPNSEFWVGLPGLIRVFEARAGESRGEREYHNSILPCIY